MTHYEQFQLLRRDRLHALQKKRPDVDVCDYVLHLDNASPRIQLLQLEIDVIRFQRLRHPPYSPDLAPMDFKVFPEVKSHLRGHRFGSTQDLVTETMKIVSSFYLDIFNKWVHRHRKCVCTGGDYKEKV